MSSISLRQRERTWDGVMPAVSSIYRSSPASLGSTRLRFSQSLSLRVPERTACMFTRASPQRIRSIICSLGISREKMATV